jgi:fatty-acyl-CoA synthase
VRVIDPERRDQPVSVPREIVARGYICTQGYYKKPEDTARAIGRSGWFHTGDMGVMRPDGHLRFIGRYKDMLKIGGENVDPMEVENFLLSHPAIKVAAVVGVPDPRLSEVAVAFVTGRARLPTDRRGGDRALSRPHDELQDPRRVAFLDEFPMTSAGKIQKVKLRERARSQWSEARP